jgi:hypothetical protein
VLHCIKWLIYGLSFGGRGVRLTLGRATEAHLALIYSHAITGFIDE